MIYELAVGLLSTVSISALGGAGLVLAQRRSHARQARTRVRAGTIKADVDAEPGALAPGLARVVQGVGEKVSSGRVSVSLREELARAGFFRPAAAGTYLGAKVLLLFIALVSLGLLVASSKLALPLKLVTVSFGALAMFMLPNLYVTWRHRRRKAEIQRHLPDAIDLLEICVTAGMGLDAAWNAVAADIRRVTPTLADEMELTSLEISLGTTRAVAMRHMADRTLVQEVASLVALLVQSDRFGASIIDALGIFAQSMREIRTQRAEESAEKMAVKMLFPMVLFIFPALMIVMVGPAAVEIYSVMVKA